MIVINSGLRRSVSKIPISVRLLGMGESIALHVVYARPTHDDCSRRVWPPVTSVRATFRLQVPVIGSLNHEVGSEPYVIRAS